jgi:hypothetical protein
LFEPLGKITYRNFLVTDENLQKLMDKGNVEDYMEFFRTKYIQRNNVQQESAPPVPEETVQRAGEMTAEASGQEPARVMEESLEVYRGPYNENIEGEHYFTFVIPVKDIDKAKFMDGLQQFNKSNYVGLGLTIEEKQLDEFRQIVLITGFPEKETAMKYFRIVVQNRDLYEPLGSGSYRNFLITKENFDTFLEQRDILDYMNFYKQVYLDQ